MKTFQRLGHDFLRFSLIIPCIMTVFLGMVTDGAFKYAAIQKAETAAFVVKLITVPIRDLPEVRI